MKKIIAISMILITIISMCTIFAGCTSKQTDKDYEIINDTPPDMMPENNIETLSAQEMLQRDLMKKIKIINMEQQALKNIKPISIRDIIG